MAFLTAMQQHLGLDQGLDDPRAVDELVERAWPFVCTTRNNGLHVQEAEELWCQACGDFIELDDAVVAPAL
jgi:hypothetical protein